MSYRYKPQQNVDKFWSVLLPGCIVGLVFIIGYILLYASLLGLLGFGAYKVFLLLAATF